jgi:hypothetical protein
LNNEDCEVEHRYVRIEQEESDDGLIHEKTRNYNLWTSSNTVYEVYLEDVGPEESLEEEEFGLDVGGQGIFSSNVDDNILLVGDSQEDGLENLEPNHDFSYVREELMDVGHQDIDDYV